MKPQFDRITYHVGHTQWFKYKGHAQETHWISRRAPSHKSFFICESTSPRRTTIRHFLDRFVRSHGCVLTRPITRRMRRRISISFCRRFFSPLLSRIIAPLIVASPISEKSYRFIVQKIFYCLVTLIVFETRNKFVWIKVPWIKEDNYCYNKKEYI